ncbi:SDR family NAD(P)-dependent oxidoreductase [Actinoplanes sp. NPDC049599]|uniref:SDR family NAD(P)-dependent oxidoreductase n=1 Tax=Actinoplanes sp. NPDC049599 TaxID=3363903 RepID=UPI0037AEC80D
MSADLSGRVSLVTGATGGMGQVVATELARLGSTVVLVARDHDRAGRVRDHIAERIGADRVEVETADLAARDDVLRLAERVSARHPVLHLLINNAGAHYRDRSVTADGLERHVAVNHLAGFLLTERLRGSLLAGAPARVVNVVSAAMNDTRQVKLRRRPRPVRLDPDELDDLTAVNGADGYTPFTAYARAKLLTLMTGYLLAAELDGTGVTVNAVHPGLVGTGIVAGITPPALRPFHGLIRRSLLTPEQGAAAILRLATAPELARVTGRYFDRTVATPTLPVSYDRELQRRVRDSSLARLRAQGERR